jgi:photosystem II stability/assembly factor-like uncharacterized protein
MNRTFLPGVFFIIAALICELDTSSAQWSPTSGPGPHGYVGSVTSYAVFGTDFFAGTQTGRVFRTSDAGDQWSPSTNGMADLSVSSLLVSGNTLLAGVRGWDGIYLTKDGWNWTPAVMDSCNKKILDLCACGNKLIAINWYGEVLRSADDGAHWSLLEMKLPRLCNVYSFVCNNTTIFAGVCAKGVFRSSDFGDTWMDMSEGLPTRSITVLAAMGDDLFAGTVGGMLRSRDKGESWTPVNSGLQDKDPIYIAAIKSRGENLFIGTDRHGIFVSHNRGESWTAINDGLTSSIITAIGVAEPWLFCGDDSGLVWRRKLSEVASADRLSDIVPSQLKLAQNYPNPFRPSTTIEFSVPQSGFVSLRVFNLFGAVVSTLVSEELRPGVYKTSWDAGGLAGGVYFYRLEQGRYVETKKLAVGR